MNSSLQPIGQALNPRRSALAGQLLTAIGILIALGAALAGYLEAARSEAVLVTLRPILPGQQISADDLGIVHLPLHRPSQLRGLADPALVVGRWAAHTIDADTLLQPAMLREQPPDRPGFPNGRLLAADMVAVPFSTASIGPLSDQDLLNIGFSDASGDLRRCPGLDPQAAPVGQPYACRILQRISVLYVDEARAVAYLELTPYQAQALWALQATGLPLWGERYGAGSLALPLLEPLSLLELRPDQLQARELPLARLVPDGLPEAGR